jgi:hypothetical protein
MSTSVKGDSIPILINGLILADILHSTFENSLKSFNRAIKEIVNNGEVAVSMQQKF